MSSTSGRRPRTDNAFPAFSHRRCSSGGRVRQVLTLSTLTGRHVPHLQERIALVTEVEVREGGGPWAPAMDAIVARPQRKEGRRVPASRTGVPGFHISSSLGQTAM